jgi:hypothetical protein
MKLPNSILAAVSVLSLIACAGSADNGTTGAAAFSGPDTPNPKPVEWDGTGAPAPLNLGTSPVQFKAGALQAAFEDALKTQDQNVSVETATYSEVPAAFLGDATAASAKQDSFQLMFRSDGNDAGGKGFGFGVSLQTTESLKCSKITAAKVPAAVAKFHGVQAILSDDQDANAQLAQTKFKPVIKDAVNAIVNADLRASLFNCSWNNHDDSDAGAIVSIDSTSSTVRVLFVFNGG